MSNKRQEKIFEQFSAYLDGELGDKERSRVDKMLQENPALHQQFLQLEATRRLLRNAPRLKVPRNFTLTTAMLPQKRAASFWLPVMSVSSALAAFILMITFIGNLAMAYKIEPMAAAPANYAESADTTAYSTEKVMQDGGATNQEPPMIIQWFGNAIGGKGGGGPSGVVPQAEVMSEQAPAAAEAMPEATAVMPAEEAPAAESETMQAFTLQMENPAAGQAADESSAAAPLATPTAVGPVTHEMDEGQNLILGVAPTEARGQIIAEQPSETTMTYEEVSQPISGLVIFRWIMLFIALSTAAVAIILRKHQRF